MQKGNAKGVRASTSTKTEPASPVGYEGRQLLTLLSQMVVLAIEARTHSHLNSYRTGTESIIGTQENVKTTASSTFSSVLRIATTAATPGATLIEAESEERFSKNSRNDAVVKESCGNIVIFSMLLTSFPSHHSQVNHMPYQLMICELICKAVADMTLQPAKEESIQGGVTMRPKLVTWSHVAQALTLLVPLSEAKALDEPVLHSISGLCVQLLSTLRAWLEDGTLNIGPHQLSMWLVIYKDLAITYRCLALDILKGMGSTDNKGNGCSSVDNKSVASKTIRNVKSTLPLLLLEPTPANASSHLPSTQVFLIRSIAWVVV